MPLQTGWFFSASRQSLEVHRRDTRSARATCCASEMLLWSEPRVSRVFGSALELASKLASRVAPRARCVPGDSCLSRPPASCVTVRCALSATGRGGGGRGGAASLALGLLESARMGVWAWATPASPWEISSPPSCAALPNPRGWHISLFFLAWGSVGLLCN